MINIEGLLGKKVTAFLKDGDKKTRAKKENCISSSRRDPGFRRCNIGWTATTSFCGSFGAKKKNTY